MKKLFVYIVAVVMLSSGIALADKFDVSKMTVPMSTILKNLRDSGYRSVKEVEFKGAGYYKIKAINPQGQYVSVRVNPETGEVVAPKEKPYVRASFDSMIKAVEIAESAGYKHVYEVERDGGDMYEVKVIDKDGKRFELKVDTKTGKVVKEWSGR